VECEKRSVWSSAGLALARFSWVTSTIFPEVKLHEERLASIGLKLNYSKMKCYVKESKKSKIYRELREAANIPEGST